MVEERVAWGCGGGGCGGYGESGGGISLAIMWERSAYVGGLSDSSSARSSDGSSRSLKASCGCDEEKGISVVYCVAIVASVVIYSLVNVQA